MCVSVCLSVSVQMNRCGQVVISILLKWVYIYVIVGEILSSCPFLSSLLVEGGLERKGKR